MIRQCRKIGEMSYMIEWYRLPGNKKLCCVLIIAMSNCSIKLTAGNIVDLTISTFTDVSIKLQSSVLLHLTTERGIFERTGCQDGSHIFKRTT
ncbi:hypothetical protein E2986_11711 [Frieseomelitta varia]|uniref:Uncharacterized protein n=1 Tax=Frieseomelitta varia TaxID=561572 RepID=A0A833VTL9_9HYME|nr:hypothetical protein E2986_11711 [Frieseomelitta varia]